MRESGHGRWHEAEAGVAGGASFTHKLKNQVQILVVGYRDHIQEVDDIGVVPEFGVALEFLRLSGWYWGEFQGARFAHWGA